MDEPSVIILTSGPEGVEVEADIREDEREWMIHSLLTLAAELETAEPPRPTLSIVQ